MDLGEFHGLVAERRQLDLQLLDVISDLDWQESGYRHLWKFLMHAMRVTRAEAKRWEHHVDMLCASTAITGQVIPPRMPVARDAVADGAVSLDQVARIAAVVDQVPVEHAGGGGGGVDRVGVSVRAHRVASAGAADGRGP